MLTALVKTHVEARDYWFTTGSFLAQDILSRQHVENRTRTQQWEAHAVGQ